MEAQIPQPTYLQTWALITSLWPDWCPNDATARLCAERWSQIRQDHLQAAAKLHKMEAAGQYKEPKVHRIMDIYAQRTTQDWGPDGTSQPKSDWKTPEITPAEIAEWDRWAEDVLADVTEEEIAEARKICSVEKPRLLACAVDVIRKRRAGIQILPPRGGGR